MANADAATTNEDVTVHVHVLTNDTDADGNPLHVGAISDPAHGTAVLAGGNAVAYTPDPNFNGTDSFTYEAVDPTGTSSTATVTVTVSPVDDPVKLAAIADKTTAWVTLLRFRCQRLTWTRADHLLGGHRAERHRHQRLGVRVDADGRAGRRAHREGPGELGWREHDRTFTVTVTKRATLLLYDGSVYGR